MHEILVDPRLTAVALVTLPEEMPVNEAIELDAALRGVVGMARGALVVNAMPEERFAPGERRRLAAMERDAPPLGPAAQAARFQAVRAEQAARYLARARAALDLPALIVPLLARERWDRAAVEEVAGALGRGLEA
jgi:hypothetical protein